MTSLRLGTRASALATAQSRATAALIAQATGVTVDLTHIRTDGDVLTGSLATMGGAGVFVTAIRQALLAGDIDIAVHSLKDLPTTPHEGTTIIVPERENPQDALCSRHGESLAHLPHGALVGTGSPRRAAQLLVARPDLRIVDIRGNVDTRLARVGLSTADKPHIRNDLDAVVLAAAGLRRLGRAHVISELLPPTSMLPAPGQGALAIEVRHDMADHHPSILAGIRTLHHQPTAYAVAAERAVLRHLEAGCAAPVGALATMHNTTLTLTATALDPRLTPTAHTPPPSTTTDINAAPTPMTAPADARPPIRLTHTHTVTSENHATEAGITLATTLLTHGAAEFLRD